MSNNPEEGFVPEGAFVNLVIEKVCDHFKLKPLLIWSDRRNRNISNPRNIVMWILRNIYGMSFPDIGLSLRRDHSTVMSGCNKVSMKMKQNNNYAAQLDVIVKSIDPRHRILENSLRYILLGNEIENLRYIADDIVRYAQQRNVNTLEVNFTLHRGSGRLPERQLTLVYAPTSLVEHSSTLALAPLAEKRTHAVGPASALHDASKNDKDK